MSKKETSSDRDIKTLSTVEHILMRPGTYIGGVKPVSHKEWILDDDDKISYKEIVYTEGLNCIINEIISNSVDEYNKTNGEFSTKINITMTKDTCSVEDNGRGIPVKKTETGDWMPVLALCRPMSGSNFTDDNRTTLGMNGLGAKATACFSTFFEAETCDSKGKLKITCKNNLSDIKVKELTPSAKTGTKITFIPDFERFGVKEFSEDLINLTKTRLKFLSWFCPKCTFTFNGEKIVFKAKDFTSLFPTPSVVINDPNIYICVYPSDEYFELSYVNGGSLPNCGSHVDYISNKVIDAIRDKVSKKYKNIKPADIRNRLSFVVLFKDFPNPLYGSQTKETLTNSQAEITEYLRKNETDLDALTAKILKEKEILDNITDLFRAKEELAEKKSLDKLDKVVREVDSEKYFPPVGKSGKKYLMITEGDSAFGGISPILGRQGIGYYKLRGKPMNILEEKPVKFMNNREIKELMQILGLTLSGDNDDMNYEKVVVLSDADADGCAIASLVITIFAKIAPKLLEQGRICRMETPLLIGMKGDKVEEYYFTFPEKSKMKKTLKFFYLKGLGSWNKSRLNQVIEKEGGMDNLIKPYNVDKTTEKTIQAWFGSDATDRKTKLRGREFHIDKA